VPDDLQAGSEDPVQGRSQARVTFQQVADPPSTTPLIPESMRRDPNGGAPIVNRAPVDTGICLPVPRDMPLSSTKRKRGNRGNDSKPRRLRSCKSCACSEVPARLEAAGDCFGRMIKSKCPYFTGIARTETPIDEGIC